MRIESFHTKNEKFVVAEGATVTVKADSPFTVYQVDPAGKRIGIVHTNPTAGGWRAKLRNMEEVEIVCPKGNYEFAHEAPDPTDKTPVSVPVQAPPTPHQKLKEALQNKAYIEATFGDDKIDFKEFTDLDMDDELPDIFAGKNLTPHEMRAEVLKQANNPFRGTNNGYIPENDPGESNKGNPNSTGNAGNGQPNNTDKSVAEKSDNKT
jgi:hypothetical protein